MFDIVDWADQIRDGIIPAITSRDVGTRGDNGAVRCRIGAGPRPKARQRAVRAPRAMADGADGGTRRKTWRNKRRKPRAGGRRRRKTR